MDNEAVLHDITKTIQNIIFVENSMNVLLNEASNRNAQ